MLAGQWTATRERGSGCCWLRCGSGPTARARGIPGIRRPIPGIAGRIALSYREPVLVGRADECGQIEALLANAATGVARCLVFDGDPGIGKTALVEYAAAAAGGFRVPRATGIESDAGLGFAGLLELTRPVIGLLSAVAAPQADALRGALGLGAPVEASRFLVAAGLLSLLAAAAERSPVLVLVDDVQWVDQASAQALLFATRRLRSDKVGVIMTVRSGEPLSVRIDGLPRATLAGLGQEAARALLAVRAPDVDRSVADRLHAATGGNPLALVEIVRTLTPSQRAGRDVLPEPMPSIAALEAAYAGRVAALGVKTRRALLVLAASGDAVLGSLGPALAGQRCAVADLAPAENLIRAGGSRCMGETDVVRDGGRWGARTTGERCGMVIDRAAATGLSRCDERVRVAATAADEQPGQRRGDPRAAPPALGPAAAARSGQGAVHPG